MSGQAGQPEQKGAKRKAPLSAEEGLKKVKRTVGWYNNNGGLQKPIIYKTVRSSLESIPPRDALKILKGLEEKSGSIRDPTAWVRSAAQRTGPEVDIKVRKTIVWYNQHGNLQAQIRYDELRTVLGNLPVGDALSILQSLEEKAGTIREPTSWIYKAAESRLLGYGASASWGKASSSGSWGTSAWSSGSSRRASSAGGSVDRKLRTTVAWYNKHGGLQQPIIFDEVAQYLSRLDVTEALKILKGLEDKAANIKNPTNWIIKAAQS